MKSELEMAETAKKIRVLVADDQNLFREMMIASLSSEPDIDVVGASVSGEETLSMVSDLKPDVVLMDIILPDVDGITVTGKIKRDCPEVKVVLLTGYHQERYIFEALQMGASGYLSKDSTAQTVKDAVRTAHQGESLLEPKVTTQLITEFVKMKRGDRTRPEEPQVEDGLRGLTTREREILKLIAQGKSNQDISSELFISEHTVKTHISNLFRKLGMTDRVQAVLFAIEKGLK
ncbi:MAG TPA: response regulator transcription factor [Candidatus Xenobia bacterium]|jgi:DNA-binding NarL/FixJ family response regulator